MSGLGNVPPWLQSVRAKAIREESYRRALKATGHTPGSVEVMLRRDRHWIDTGTDKPDGGR